MTFDELDAHLRESGLYSEQKCKQILALYRTMFSVFDEMTQNYPTCPECGAEGRPLMRLKVAENEPLGATVVLSAECLHQTERAEAIMETAFQKASDLLPGLVADAQLFSIKGDQKEKLP